MGTVEFEVGFIGGRLVYDGKAALPLDFDGYVRTVVSPGFSDSHAHPQVVDVGERRLYKNSYEWIMSRRLSVDESGIREDPEVSSNLALATMLLSLFEGVTLIALTGSFQGNVLALKKLERAHPRVVLQPTVLDRRGWLSPEGYLAAFEKLFQGSETFKLGLFLHSLGLSSPETISRTMKIAKEKGLVMAMHVSEGVFEARSVLEASEANGLDAKRQIVAVHCFTEPRTCKALFKGVVSCPTSNLYLYGKTIKSPRAYDALGSDWPLVTGTVRSSVRDALEVSEGRGTEVLKSATLGGYLLYDVEWSGDAAFFDAPLSRVLRDTNERPKFVFVGGKRLVDEGVLIGFSDYNDVVKLKEEAVKTAFSKYGTR